MPTYTFSFYQFSDMTFTGDAGSTSETEGVSGSFTINAGAIPVTITLTDDDLEFEDAYIDLTDDQLLSVDVTANGVNYLASQNNVVELEFDVEVDSGDTFLYIRIDGVNVGIGGVTMPDVGVTYTIEGSNDGQERLFTDLACFTRGTMIDTIDGPRPIQSLLKGDMVRTMDSGYQPLTWIGHRHLGAVELAQKPQMRPIVIAKNALGNDTELRVSPQHRMLMSDWRAQMYFGQDDVLIPAKSLVNGETIFADEAAQGVTYYHLLFETHEVVYGAGIPSESFHPGEQGMDGLHNAARAELGYLFPDMVANPNGYSATAYFAPKTRIASAIDWRHAA